MGGQGPEAAVPPATAAQQADAMLSTPRSSGMALDGRCACSASPVMSSADVSTLRACSAAACKDMMICIAPWTPVRHPGGVLSSWGVCPAKSKCWLTCPARGVFGASRGNGGDGGVGLRGAQSSGALLPLLEMSDAHQELLLQLLGSPQGGPAGLSSHDSGLLRSLINERLATPGAADSPAAGRGAPPPTPGGNLPQPGRRCACQAAALTHDELASEFGICLSAGKWVFMMSSTCRGCCCPVCL